MNWPTVIVLLVVLALVVVDIIALHRGKGRCNCGDNKSTSSRCANCSVNCPLKGK